MRCLRGKKALLTGAASGIGRALALRLAREGADLYLVDIDEDGLAEVVGQAREAGVQVIGARCDVSRPEELTRTVEEVLGAWGAVDLLINNAGVAYYGPTVNMSAQQWDWLLAINLHAPIRLTCQLLPTLLAREESHVLNIASVAGLVAGGRFCAYHVSKFGLVGFSQALRAEFGRQGLGVTAICPGPVLTKLYDSAPSGHKHKPTPTPPAWICTTADRVAEKAVRAIRRDRGLVLVSPLAYALYYSNRLAPGLIDAVQRFGRRKKLRQKSQEPEESRDKSQESRAGRVERQESRVESRKSRETRVKSQNR